MYGVMTVLGVVAVMAGCGGGDGTTGPTPPPPPPGPVVAVVAVSPEAGTVRVGTTFQLSATVSDAQGSPVPGKTPSWTSSDLSRATVSPSGLVTGVARGAVTITATVDGRSGSATLQVTDETALLPVASCRDCLEIGPGGLLLPGPGQEAQLVAYLVDAAGQRTRTTATFTSAKPAVVSISGAGVARAVAFGSAQVTAQANGRTSAPILVLVASPVEGALLVADSVVVGRPVPSNLNATYGVGYLYKVRLRGLVPTVGQTLVGSGSLPVLGRVVRVTPVETGVVEAELELRTLQEMFRELTITERMALAEPVTAAAPTPALWGLASVPQLAEDPLEEGEFRLGPFVCKSSIGASVGLPLTLDVGPLDMTPILQADVSVNSTGGPLIAVTGSLTPEINITARFTAAVEAELECRKTIHKLRVRGNVGGLLGMLVFPVVPVGVGFKVAIKADVPGLGFTASLQGTTFTGMAMNCASFQCVFVTQPPTVSLTPTFTPIIPAIGNRIEAEAGLFLFAELELSNVLAEGVEEVFGADTEVTLLDLTAGMKQTVALGPLVSQADDDQYASEAKLSAFWEAESGAEVEVVDWLSIELLDYTQEGDTAIARTPQGTVEFAEPTIRAGSGNEPGEPALLRVTLDPVTYLGSEAVAEVLIYRKQGSALTPVCGTLVPEQPGQNVFECELTFREQDVGTHTYYAFVTAKIFGATFATPMEIGPDGKATIEVLEPCGIPAGPAGGSPWRAGDESCGRVIEGNLTVATNAELAQLADVFAVTGDLVIGAGVTSPDLQPLEGLESVGGELRIEGQQLTLTGLKNLRRASGITVAGNTIQNVHGLERLVDLLELRLRSRALADLSGLRNLRKVLVLEIRDLRMKSLSSLANLAIGTTALTIPPGWDAYFAVQAMDSLATLSDLKPLPADFQGDISLALNPRLTDVSALRNVTRVRRSLSVFRNPVLVNLAPLAGLQQVDGSLALAGVWGTGLDSLAALTTVGSLFLYPEDAPATFRLPALTQVTGQVLIQTPATNCQVATVGRFEFPLLTATGNLQFFTDGGRNCTYDFIAPSLTTTSILGSSSGLRDLTLGALGTAGVNLSHNPRFRAMTAPGIDMTGTLALDDNPLLTQLTGITGRIRSSLFLRRNASLDQCAARTWALSMTVNGGRFVTDNKDVSLACPNLVQP